MEREKNTNSKGKYIIYMCYVLCVMYIYIYIYI